ncbi:MAG TPA: peptidylprolyl isomerase [Agriterribacter sp.]|nr:peptidylprolyl isomerase [Agriterribacter sp.]
MRKILFFTVLLLTYNLLPAQTLFSYGRHKVDKEEFLRAFNKNNTGDSTEQAMRDYLNLYIGFKLKVQAAKDRKIDTLADQKNDLLNFRRQIEKDYLIDDQVVNELVKEAFQRSQKDILISHIFIPFEESYIQDPSNYAMNNAADTVVAWQKIQQAYSAAKRGDDFGSVAQQYSLDPSVKSNKGDLGFITVFSLPYTLESVAYTLPAGAFSEPIKSSVGYHIFKKIAERPAIGKMRAAQILLAYASPATDKEKQEQKKLADSLYQALQRGADFETLAKQFSSDRNAYTTGGLMPDFGVGRYDAAFENAAFALQKDGDISAPFETTYGIHIVKRIKRLPVSKDSTEAENLFKETILQDNRVTLANEKFAEQIGQRIGYKKQFPDERLWQITDHFIVNNNFSYPKGIADQTILFSFAKEDKTMKAWLSYVETVRHNYSDFSPAAYPAIMKDFVSQSSKEYYRNHLEDYNSAFRNQLTEFEEGNLLFEIMEQEVWNKAAEDSKGLQQYYDQHKEKYTWGPSVNAIFFTAADRKTADEVIRDIDNYVKKWKTLAESSSGNIIADSARVELAQVPGGNGNLQPGQVTVPVTDINNGSTNFVYILKVYQEPAPRSFEEAKGLVINDYQAVLEEKWLARLKKKYPVKINEPVFQSMLN